VIVANTGYDPERMSHSARRMIERKAEGVAVMTSEMQQNFIAQLETRRIPMVFLDTGRVGLRTSNIRVDYEKGIDEAMAHLVGLGHERIGFISGPLEYASAIARRDAFLKYLQQYGLVKDEDLLQVGDFMLGGGEVAMGRMLSLKKPPTAVLASNDLSAIGAMRTALHLGLRVPEDISIIGFDHHSDLPQKPCRKGLQRPHHHHGRNKSAGPPVRCRNVVNYPRLYRDVQVKIAFSDQPSACKLFFNL
jgi:LacI family transcriptional regulator